MEGAAPLEPQDKLGVDPRFQVLKDRSNPDFKSDIRINNYNVKNEL